MEKESEIQLLEALDQLEVSFTESVSMEQWRIQGGSKGSTKPPLNIK